VELKRVLKPSGSFFLNIKPHTDGGERSLYVFELVLMLKREIGFLFVEEYCWTKNAFPGALRGRLKNAFEPIYHFTKQKPSEILFNPTACGTPIKEESIARTYRKQCGTPQNGSGMAAMNATNIRNLKIARPSNVVHVNNVSNQFTLKNKHSATFPENLVDFFLKTFTNEGCVVLDPFAGSGTTALSCIKNNRKFILIEKEEGNIKLIKERIAEIEKNPIQPKLF
jgi:site-specific DNA-methyltransferase (adenine-specific)/site-specific DNA-methyltransferase (cytosine-N4-specific)